MPQNTFDDHSTLVQVIALWLFSARQQYKQIMTDCGLDLQEQILLDLKSKIQTFSFEKTLEKWCLQNYSGHNVLIDYIHLSFYPDNIPDKEQVSMATISQLAPAGRSLSYWYLRYINVVLCYLNVFLYWQYRSQGWFKICTQPMRLVVTLNNVSHWLGANLESAVGLLLQNKHSICYIPHWFAISLRIVSWYYFLLLVQQTDHAALRKNVITKVAFITRTSLNVQNIFHFYPRPVLASGYCRCPCPSVRPSGIDGNYRSRKITARRWLHKYVGAECGASSFTWYLR